MQSTEYDYTRRSLAWYAVLNYPLLLLIMWTYMRTLANVSAAVDTFVAAVYLSYAALFLAVAWAIPRAILWVNKRFLTPLAARAILWLAVLSMSVLCLLLFIDSQLYMLYGFHLNGFVWNLLTTPGGLESMGISTSAVYTVGALAVVVLLLQWGLMVLGARRLAAREASRRNAKLFRYALCALIVLGVGERLSYGFAHIKAYAPIVLAAKTIPLYHPLTFRGLAKFAGYKVVKDTNPKLSARSGPIQYPAVPLQIVPPAKPLNIVWLTSESWRWDMLDPSIMPATWAFAKQARHYMHHYSGGNGTRMGLFSMFFGLYGNYWFPMLAQHRGPVLLDVLKKEGYTMEMYTSASFSYPEFDKTIFAQIPPQHLHQDKQGASWERDRANVTDLIASIDKRDKSKPFMRFMFFESPHARYQFPPETAIRKPYLEDFNYATMNLQRDIGLIKNRYINSCAHLDTQFARIIDYLKREKLLDNTIVIMTGDHGEEFMEKGRWGHNSAFDEEQIHTPFVLWVPGQAPAQIDHMTSHLDVAATLMPLLGVKNPPSDYSLGTSMIDGEPRQFTVVASWEDLGYRDDQFKASFPFEGGNMIGATVKDGNDKPLPDGDVFFQQRQEQIGQMIRNSVRFNRPANLAKAQR